VRATYVIPLRFTIRCMGNVGINSNMGLSNSLTRLEKQLFYFERKISLQRATCYHIDGSRHGLVIFGATESECMETSGLNQVNKINAGSDKLWSMCNYVTGPT
jgi:hypothetical protein